MIEYLAKVTVLAIKFYDVLAVYWPLTKIPTASRDLVFFVLMTTMTITTTEPITLPLMLINKIM